MITGRRIAVNVGAALLAAMLTLLLVTPSRAQSCSPQDVWNDLSNAWQGIGNCAGACGSGFGCFAAFAIAATLAAADAAGDQGAVTTFCTDVTNAQSNADAIVGYLAQIPGVSQSTINNVKSIFGSVADPFAAAQCACEEVQSVSSLIQDVGNCIVAGLCDASALFGTPCGCTEPPTTVSANCASNIQECSQFYHQDPSDPIYQLCHGQGGSIMTDDNWSAPVMVINTPGGTEVLQSASGSAAFGTCGTTWACLCPKPMQLQPICNVNYDYNCQANQEFIYACVCPAGTTPAGATAQNPTGTLTNGINTCLCPDGKPIMSEPGATADLPCPGPLLGAPCPNGQERRGDKCVTPCAKSEVMTPDGTCCDPNQVTYCGQCCPPYMTPNPQNGTCTNEQIQ
jgi:hypothetical protein